MLTEWDSIFTVFRFSGGPGNRNPLRKTWRYLLNNKFQSQLKKFRNRYKRQTFKCISSKIWETNRRFSDSYTAVKIQVTTNIYLV